MKDLSDICGVFLQAFEEDQYVIQVDEYKLVYHVPENVIYESLENSRNVRQAKRHHQVFPVPSRIVKRCFPLIPFSDANQVISVP